MGLGVFVLFRASQVRQIASFPSSSAIQQQQISASIANSSEIFILMLLSSVLVILLAECQRERRAGTVWSIGTELVCVHLPSLECLCVCAGFLCSVSLRNPFWV